MKKPYIVCHMMTSLDGRIDCAMTEQLPGVDDYYQTLEALTGSHHRQRPGDRPAGDGPDRGIPGQRSHAGGEGGFLQEGRRPRLRNRCGYPRQALVAGCRGTGKAAPDPHQRAGAPGVSDLPGQPEHLLDRRGERADRSGPGRRDPGGGVRCGAHGRCGRLRHQHQLSGLPACWTRSASSSAPASTAGAVCRRCSTACPCPIR